MNLKNKIRLALGIAMCLGGSALAQTRAEIRHDLQQRIKTNKCAHATEALALAKDDAMSEALEFLYAYMPDPDWTDYAPEYYVAQTEAALKARKEMAWGRTVPDREWLHFVLPVRVNNENLDAFRTTCYDELRQRVQGLGMTDAVIAVNRWCHEHVTYKPSDSRTSSPLASMRTAYGRCGEESTYGVAAFRAVGIPARQVYTPRWAHTDDNHAWVEVWVDDGPKGAGWYFLGACEPEPVLNLGWFNQPASRGMLMHTKVFGRYDGPEDKIVQNKIFCEINVTENYAKTARTNVTVVDEMGRVKCGVDVHFKIYNYAEFFTAVKQTTDEEGKCSVLTGLGDLMVWGSKDGMYGFQKVTAGKGDIVLRLDHKSGETYACDFDITPPVGFDNVPYVSAEQAAYNEVCKAREDSIRNAYVASFPTEEDVRKFCATEGLDYDVVRPLVEKSRGNYANLYRLLRNFKNRDVFALLGSMSEKDIRDFNYDVVADHIVAADLPQKVSQFEARYVYSPRIYTEGLSAWRSYFKTAFSKKEQQAFKANPERLVRWIGKHVKMDDAYNPGRQSQCPESGHRYRASDRKNVGLLYVAIARSCGIPARIDEVTGKTQYAVDAESGWTDVVFERDVKTTSSSAKLTLAYTPREYMEDPRYYTHFSLSELRSGQPYLQEYAEEAVWSKDFARGAAVDKGDYCLISGTRLADGGVMAHMEVFPVTEGEQVTVPLVMRKDDTKVQVIGGFNSENTYFDTSASKVQSLLATTGRGYFVTGLIRANHEPSNHILHDISALRNDLEAWGRPIVLLFRSHDELDRFYKNCAEFDNLPSTLSFGVDVNGEFADDLFNSGLVKTEDLPVIIIGDTFNRVVFCSQGYTIGMGEQLKQTIGKIR